MSHTDRCPDRWTAEREGERAQEYGRGRYANPYDDPFSREHCDEASEAWRSGYRRAEIREEEQREEEAAHHRAAIRRAEAEDEESYYLERERQNYMQAQEYYAEVDAREADESQPSAAAVDQDGPAPKADA